MFEVGQQVQCIKTLKPNSYGGITPQAGDVLTVQKILRRVMRSGRIKTVLWFDGGINCGVNVVYWWPIIKRADDAFCEQMKALGKTNATT